MVRFISFHRYVSLSLISSFCSSSSINHFAKRPLVWKRNSLVRDAHIESIRFLKSHAIDDADVCSRYMICDIKNIGYRLSDFTRNLDAPLSNNELSRLYNHCLRRVAHEPVQFILGNWDFYGLTFICRPPILIPRPETEELVEMMVAANIIKPDSLVLDVGTGTGAIGISLMSEIKGIRVLGLDINQAAVDLSKENARRLLGDGISRYDCVHRSFKDFTTNAMIDGVNYAGKFDVIVSNPPYIPSAEMPCLMPEVRLFEDHGALHGGSDGLDIIKQIVDLCFPLFRPLGPRELWMEVSHTHPQMIEEYLRGSGGRMAFVESKQDLSGRPRFVRLRSQAQK